MSYYSIAGILKILEMLLSLTIVICTADAEAKCLICVPTRFMMGMGITAIIVSFALILAFSFNLNESIDWTGIELFSSMFYLVSYSVGSCWVAANVVHANIATVIIGFIIAAMYVASIWLALFESPQLYRKRHAFAKKQCIYRKL